MEQINNYVIEARTAGQSDEQIRQSLVTAGWPEQQIDAAIPASSVNTVQSLAGPQAQPMLNPAAIDSTMPQPQPLPTNPQPASTNPLFNQKPVANPQPISSYQSPHTQPQEKTKFNKRLLMIGLGILLIVIIASSAIALFGKKSSYQTAANEFISAIQNKDKAKADSLESPAAQSYFKKYGQNASFYTICERSGDFCTPLFTASNISDSTKTVNSYTAKNGIKGEAITYTRKQTTGTGSCKTSGESTLTIDLTPARGSWLIDNVNPNVSFDAKLCPTNGDSTTNI
jgi:hypothetical protein